jgi:hypothetical protein
MKNTAGKAQAADRIFSAFSSNDWSSMASGAGFRNRTD